MGHVMAHVELERTTLLPEDRVVNVFHFETLDPGPVVADYESIATRLQNFYRNPAGGTNDLQHWMSSVLIGGVGTHKIKMYNRADPIPRAPRAIAAITLNPGGVGGITLPSEVALCLSLHGIRALGVRAARARGRLYLGPFMGGAIAAPAAGDSRPNATLQGIMNNAAVALRTVDLGVPRWSVFSPSDNALRRVTGSHVDNAWDTQRRRGADPTARLATNDI